MSLLTLMRGTDEPNTFGPACGTPQWERVAGIFGIVLFVSVALIGILTASGIPACTHYTDQAGQAGF